VGTIRKSVTSLSALAVFAGISACSDARANDVQAEFQRDLQLASSDMKLATPAVDPSLLTLENKPLAAPAPATTVKQGPGTRAIRSRTPTVRAEVTEEPAPVEEENDVLETLAEAPVPEPTSEPVAIAPRPTPVLIPASTGPAGDYGTGSGGGGVVGNGGGRGGVVIRGGGVDGDNCELHRNGGRRGGIYIPQTVPISRQPVYQPQVMNSGIGGFGVGSRSGSARTARGSTPSRVNSMPSAPSAARPTMSTAARARRGR
jgi:hypothetical protein